MHNMKTCNKCFRSLAQSNFYKHKRSKDRLHYTCKDCIKTAAKFHKNSVEEKLKTLIRSIKHRAKAKEIEFTICYEDLSRLWKEQAGKCFYTNIPLTFNIPWGRSEISVDRVNPKKGYTPDNIVLSAFIFNSVKTSLTIDELSHLASQFLQKFPPKQEQDFDWTTTNKSKHS